MGPVSVSTDTNGVIKVLPPKTAEEILARERERKARTTLLMALPEDHLAKFHKITDAKERSKGNQDSRRGDAWNTGNKAKDNERRSDKQEQLGDTSIEIQAYTQALKESYEAPLVYHQQNQLCANDVSGTKSGLGYGDQMNKGVLSYENDVFGSLFNSRSSDIEDVLMNDRILQRGMLAVPPHNDRDIHPLYTLIKK
ncbi:hypothetical protein Tco_0367658 [Tanacetum coccineum]